MEFISGLLIALVAFAIGFFSGKIFSTQGRRIKDLEQTVAEHQQQHQSYKKQVAEHFSGSADLFGDITEKYRALYDHMSSGAYGLCDRRDFPRELAASHVNILAVESPEVSPQLTDRGKPMSTDTNNTDEFVVDVSRSGMSPLDAESHLIIQQNKTDQESTAEIIDLNSQRSEDVPPLEQAKDYAIKAKGVINHNSLNQDDVST